MLKTSSCCASWPPVSSGRATGSADGVEVVVVVEEFVEPGATCRRVISVPPTESLGVEVDEVGLRVEISSGFERVENVLASGDKVKMTSHGSLSARLLPD